MEPMIYTHSGIRINVLDPQPEQIQIEDIAHALALCNRFAGHTQEPISVAQHSVYASRLCEGPAALQALLHDASEAYLGDITKWLKAVPEMAAYRAAEDRVQRVIYRRFGCAEEDDEQVVRADKLLVRYEMLVGFNGRCSVGVLNPERERDYPPLTDTQVALVTGLYGGYTFWPWRRAEATFLARFNHLTRSCDAPQVPQRQQRVPGAGGGDTPGHDPDIAAS